MEYANNIEKLNLIEQEQNESVKQTFLKNQLVESQMKLIHSIFTAHTAQNMETGNHLAMMKKEEQN